MKVAFRLFVLVGLFSSSFIAYSTAHSPDHDQFTSFLKKHVSKNGFVNYKTLTADSSSLNSYIQLLSKNTPGAGWTEKEKLAYWINVYNAYTLRIVSRHYPLTSITTIKKTGAKDVWAIKFIKIGGQLYSLNEIENEVIRKRFNEPRIHFAVNCASYSCPNLLNEAYTEVKLESQLESQTRKFINDPSKNKIGADQISISKLFDWYKADFTKNGTVIDFINKYSITKTKSGSAIRYMDYSWKLNGQ